MKTWTDEELMNEFHARGTEINGQKMLSKKDLEGIFIDPRFPKDKSEKMIDFLKFFTKIENGEIKPIKKHSA